MKAMLRPRSLIALSLRSILSMGTFDTMGNFIPCAGSTSGPCCGCGCEGHPAEKDWAALGLDEFCQFYVFRALICPAVLAAFH